MFSSSMNDVKTNNETVVTLDVEMNRKCDMKRVDKSKIVKSSRGMVDFDTYTVRSYVNGGKMEVWKHNL